jgi:hypothetical protein
MVALVAVIWIVLDARGTTPSIDVGRGWALAGVADVALTPLFTYPGYENGSRVTAGFRVTHPLAPHAEFVWSGRAGATRVDDWRGLFESSVGVDWTPAGVEIRAGLRHDDRLSREGARASFRDPTGRVVLQADVLPLRNRWFALGATVEYQRGIPGELRLPSTASAEAVARIRWGPSR